MNFVAADDSILICISGNVPFFISLVEKTWNVKGEDCPFFIPDVAIVPCLCDNRRNYRSVLLPAKWVEFRRDQAVYRLFIVEDDSGIADAIGTQARMWDLQVACARNFRNIMAEFAAFDPHLVLLDIGLPYFNGYHWCNEIRKVSKVPIIFISSASDNMNIVMAINMGGDDFISKPFDQSVLMAKVQAMLRRTYDFAGSAPVLEHRGAMLNTGDNTLTFGNEKIQLSKNEYRILRVLMENKGKIVSREKLMEHLWESESFVDENTLSVNVNRLRRKLDAVGLTDFITTKFGVGYLIRDFDRGA